MWRWSILSVSEASKKLKNGSPRQARATQGIQPMTYQCLHPLGLTKIKINLDFKTVPIWPSSFR
jgi:hypothetical protein